MNAFTRFVVKQTSIVIQNEVRDNSLEVPFGEISGERCLQKWKPTNLQKRTELLFLTLDVLGEI